MHHASCTQNITIDSKAFAQLPVPNVKSNTSRIITSSVATNFYKRSTILELQGGYGKILR
jgi:hypothetical protein